jgi:hypothetical protein
VIHSPGECVPGKERSVVCDYWRVWSNAKPDTQFHQLVMRKIAAHYKTKIPTLTRLKVKSDGCRWVLVRVLFSCRSLVTHTQVAVQRQEKTSGRSVRFIPMEVWRCGTTFLRATTTLAPMIMLVKLLGSRWRKVRCEPIK